MLLITTENALVLKQYYIFQTHSGLALDLGWESWHVIV